jgi:hypothetical protein
MSETPLNPDQNSDEIDLRDIILPLWKARKQILTTAIIFSIIGGIIGFLTPATYTASSTFLPQTAQAGGGLSGSLGGLASLAGINLSTGAMGGGEIPPSMYATVLASEPFRRRILDANIWVNGDSLTYRDYLVNQPKSMVGTVLEYTIGLPGKIAGSGSDISPLPINGELQALSDEENELHKALAGKISISNDKKEGVVSLTVTEGNPLIAAQVAKVTEEILQDWIIEHKVKNAKAQYDFIENTIEWKDSLTYGKDLDINDFFLISNYTLSTLDVDTKKKYLFNLLPKTNGCYMIWNSNNYEGLPFKRKELEEYPKTGDNNKIIII